MDPYGHRDNSEHHRHHHRRQDDDDDNELREGNFYPPPPPPSYQQNIDFEPPTRVAHAHHDSYNYEAPPPPQPARVGRMHHESHSNYDAPPPPFVPAYGSSTDYMHNASPEFGVPQRTETHQGYGPLYELSKKPTYKVYSKADPNYYLTISNGKVILAPAASHDDSQHWYKDEKYSTRVKDEEGSPAFALVNKATGLAMKHSIGATHPVQLKPYSSDVMDESILWTESKDFGSGYRTVRMVNNVHLNMDAYEADKKHGGVHNGTTIVLWKWNKGDNQLWKITPH